MSVNVLGWRKQGKIIDATALPVVRAWVRSHEDSGRMAYLTIGWGKDHRHHRHHRHAWYDRRTGALSFDQAESHNASCYDLFPEEMGVPRRLGPRGRAAAVTALGRLLDALGGE